MGNTELVLELLEARSSQPLCDDCISAATHIEPRQQVNQITRRLADRGVTTRDERDCADCGDTKKCSVLQGPRQPLKQARVAEAAAVYSPPSIPAPRAMPHINEMRDHIVRFCRGIASDSVPDAKDLGPTRLIAALRDAETVPPHQANMMLTLCGLRNSYSYDQVSFGPRELSIAGAAWDIVKEWATANYDSAWRLTSMKALLSRE